MTIEIIETDKIILTRYLLDKISNCLHSADGLSDYYGSSTRETQALYEEALSTIDTRKTQDPDFFEDTDFDKVEKELQKITKSNKDNK